MDRSSFVQLLGWEMKRGARYRRTFTLLRVGVDPATRSTLPKGAVDEPAIDTMRQVLRDVDLVARLDAGDFGVLLPETGISLISPVFQRLLDALVQRASTSAWPVTFSVGAVTWKDAQVSAEYLMERAHQLLVQARGDSSRVVEHEVLI